LFTEDRRLVSAVGQTGRQQGIFCQYSLSSQGALQNMVHDINTELRNSFFMNDDVDLETTTNKRKSTSQLRCDTIGNLEVAATEAVVILFHCTVALSAL
jgi:hypothetical protein